VCKEERRLGTRAMKNWEAEPWTMMRRGRDGGPNKTCEGLSREKTYDEARRTRVNRERRWREGTRRNCRKCDEFRFSVAIIELQIQGDDKRMLKLKGLGEV